MNLQMSDREKLLAVVLAFLVGIVAGRYSRTGDTKTVEVTKWKEKEVTKWKTSTVSQLKIAGIPGSTVVVQPDGTVIIYGPASVSVTTSSTGEGSTERTSEGSRSTTTTVSTSRLAIGASVLLPLPDVWKPRDLVIDASYPVGRILIPIDLKVGVLFPIGVWVPDGLLVGLGTRF